MLICLRKFGKEILGGYTFVWSAKSKNDELSSKEINNNKIGKLRLTMSGYYNSIKNDLRKLYYSINEIKLTAK